MQDHFFDERGIAYRTNEFDRTRQSLVFVHGLSSCASAWSRYEEAFERDYNVLTYDLRGHGKSHKPRGASYSIGAMADDLLALIDRLELDRVVLIGHSYGAMIALEFLVGHQDRVSRAVLLSPEYRTGRRLEERILNAALRPLSILDALPLSTRPSTHVDYAPYLGTADWNARRLLADIRNTSLRVYLSCTRQSYGFDRERSLGEVTIPVLLVQGKRDSIFPVANSQYMAGRIAGARLILLEHADHIVVLNNFTEVSGAISEFIHSAAAGDHRPPEGARA